MTGEDQFLLVEVKI